jgi:hypothetical protein
MRSHARVSLLALLTGVLIAAMIPSVAQAAFGVESFFASNCKAAFEGCKKPVAGTTKAQEIVLAETEGYRQAAGHPPFGITDFTVNTQCQGGVAKPCPKGLNPLGEELEILEPSGGIISAVDHVRTDVAPGVSTNPFGVAQCTMAEFGKNIAGTAFFEKPTCSEAGVTSTVLGENKVTVEVPSPAGEHPAVFNVKLHGTVYNLIPREAEGEKPALASEFGVALEIPKGLAEALSGGLIKVTVFAHTLIEGSVEWSKEAGGTAQADYHDYFEIEVSPELPLLSSRLVFHGMLNQLGKGAFLTNGSSCPGNHTSTLTLKDLATQTTRETYETPVGTTGCLGEAPFKTVPFNPGLAISQGSTAPDSPDALTTEVTVPHSAAIEVENETTQLADSSQVKDVTIVLPPGLTLNSAAAAGLEKCTPEEIGLENKKIVNRENTCPEGSKIGTAAIEVPDLPAGALQGSVYLGGPASGPITGSPFTIYVAAQSKRYGIDVRVEGKTFANEETGQLTTTFENNPEQPFSNVILNFNGGPFAPLANGVACEKGEAEATLKPYTLTASQTPKSLFEIGGCPGTTPFALTQSTENENGNGGGHTNYTLTMSRNAGEQYLEKIKTTLPEGLLAAIPSTTPCEGTAAETGTCAESAKVGTATVLSGAGGIPATFKGPVYLTGPYLGAPYGLSIAVPAAAGPFNLGTVVTRATININPTNSQVTVESVVPKIFKGVPLRIRSISVAINRQGYLFNPTNCQKEATVTTLTSVGGAATQEKLESPFQVANCEALSFSPAFKAASSAKFSKKGGASLSTTITQSSGQANIKFVKVQLPIQLPSRQETLNKACLAAVFEANLANCPAGSKVGNATVVTPALPGKLEGPAYLVSHGGEKFPDLDLILEDKGVKIILVGNTDIKKGITTTTFASNPDAPISSVTVNLPSGTGSLLGANGDLCLKPLVMPTTIISQSGKTIKQNTIISVPGCGVKIVGHKVVGNSVILTVKTFAAGRISGSGTGLSSKARSLSKATNTASLVIPLSSKGRHKHKPFKTKIRVGFVPKAKGAHSSATVTVTVR